MPTIKDYISVCSLLATFVFWFLGVFFVFLFLVFFFFLVFLKFRKYCGRILGLPIQRSHDFLAMPSFQLETQPPRPWRLECAATQVHQSPSPDHVNCKEVLGMQSFEKSMQSFEKGTPAQPVTKLPTLVFFAGGTEKNQTEVKSGKDRRIALHT